MCGSVIFLRTSFFLNEVRFRRYQDINPEYFFRINLWVLHLLRISYRIFGYGGAVGMSIAIADILRRLGVDPSGNNTWYHLNIQLSDFLLALVLISSFAAIVIYGVLNRFLFRWIIVVSHRWLLPDNPDPTHWQFLALKRMAQEKNERPCSQVGGRSFRYVFYDYCCLPQNSPVSGYISDEDREIRATALSPSGAVNYLYQNHTVVKLTTGDYWNRGWCVVEAGLNVGVSIFYRPDNLMVKQAQEFADCVTRAHAPRDLALSLEDELSHAQNCYTRVLSGCLAINREVVVCVLAWLRDRLSSADRYIVDKDELRQWNDTDKKELRSKLMQAISPGGSASRGSDQSEKKTLSLPDAVLAAEAWEVLNNDDLFDDLFDALRLYTRQPRNDCDNKLETIMDELKIDANRRGVFGRGVRAALRNFIRMNSSIEDVSSVISAELQNSSISAEEIAALLQYFPSICRDLVKGVDLVRRGLLPFISFNEEKSSNQATTIVTPHARASHLEHLVNAVVYALLRTSADDDADEDDDDDDDNDDHYARLPDGADESFAIGLHDVPAEVLPYIRYIYQWNHFLFSSVCVIVLFIFHGVFTAGACAAFLIIILIRTLVYCCRCCLCRRSSAISFVNELNVIVRIPVWKIFEMAYDGMVHAPLTLLRNMHKPDGFDLWMARLRFTNGGDRTTVARMI